MAAFHLPRLQLSLLLVFFLHPQGSLGLPDSAKNSPVGKLPPTCSRIECPNYDVIDAGGDYEIRRYNSTLWMSTSALAGASLVGATRIGFLKLFDYIQGKNKYGERIEMTAPVITQVFPGDGPLCASSFLVSFYVPKKNQGRPPPAEGLTPRKWKVRYVAVRQFGGFVSDDEVGEVAGALKAGLAGSRWSAAVDDGRAGSTPAYTVAQYNSPFEYKDRVNEVWITLKLDAKFAAS